MALGTGWYAGELRRELMARNRVWARGSGRVRPHVESYGRERVIVYEPDGNAGHGNFFPDAYAAMIANKDWMRRFDKIHAQGRALPKAEPGPNGEPARRWRELDSSMSSDALLMNVFLGFGTSELGGLKRVLGVEADELPVFGWKARVPLASAQNGRARFDRTEVDMRWGRLLVEAKLTETDFQTRAAKGLEGYRDFDAVFDRELLPRVELRAARRRTAVEFAEEFTQEWEEPAALPEFEANEVAREFQAGIVARAREAEPVEAGYAGYQLIRNVLAAYAEGCSFCVVHDERRPDLREGWFNVMKAVRSAEMRTRCKVMTWQELAGLAPAGLQEFLELKYGILGAGKAHSSVEV